MKGELDQYFSLLLFASRNRQSSFNWLLVRTTIRHQLTFFLFALLCAFAAQTKEVQAQFSRISSEEQPFMVSTPTREENRIIAEQLPELTKMRSFVFQSRQEFSRIMGANLSLVPQISIVSESRSKSVLGSYATAAFSRGWIYISAKSLMDRVGLYQTIRHETAHLAVYELSHGKCPAWIDEGLAQVFEGTAHPHHRLDRAMEEIDNQADRFSHRVNEITLGELGDNLTMLEPERVSKAYHYAKVAVQSLINRYGMAAMRNYLIGLRTADSAGSFFANFGLTEEQFESQLKAGLSGR